MKQLNLAFFFTLQATISLAQTPGFEWVHAHGSTNSDQGRAVITDNQHNVYLTGTYNGTVDFDPGTGVTNLTSFVENGFIQKLDANGNLVWVKSFPDGMSTPTSINLDPSGNIILGGYFAGNVPFQTVNGNDTLLSPDSGTNAFVVKMNPSGDFIWVRGFGGSNNDDYNNGVQTDDQGNIYSTGHFSGLSDFDPGPGTELMNSAGGNMDIFVHKLSASGDFVWVKKIGGGGFDDALSVAVRGNTILITGWFQNTVDFDPSPGSSVLNSQGSSDIYLVCLSTDGHFNWAKAFGSVYTDQGMKVVFDNNGDIYLAGVFDNDIDLDPGPATNTFTPGMGTSSFILKLTAAGNFSWAKAFTGTAYNICRSISLHPNNGVVITGEFKGTNDFDPGSGIYNLTSNNEADIFIVYLEANGTYRWAGSFGNAGFYNDLARDITIDGLGNIYTTGWFVETVDFDCGPGAAVISSSGSNDIFIHKLNSNVLSADENSLIDFNIYPNPSSRFVSISAESLNNCRAVIYNSLGTIVLEKELSDTDNQLDIQKLSPGSYVVQLTNEYGSKYQNFLKTD
jgi:hypothetical protein